MKSLSVFSLSLLSGALLATHGAHADDTLDTVVVTATRSADTAPVLPTATVITREQIAERQASSLADILASEAGITVATNGGPLTATGVFLRGSASKHILVLVDGVRVNDANQGAFDFSQLRADEIERIEIVRGPYSSQYGSDAIGGVIQIFTRKTEKADISIRAGSFGTQEYSAGFSQGDSDAGISLRAGYFDTDGFSATNAKNYSFNPDKDGGQAKNSSISAWNKITDTAELRLNGAWKEVETEFDQGLSTQTQSRVALSLKHMPSSIWSHQLQISYLNNDLDTDGRSDPGGAYYSNFVTTRSSASWTQELTWAKGFNLVGGVDYSDEAGKSRDVLANTTSFDEHIRNTGVFLSQSMQAGIVSGSLSARNDHHETFGDHQSGSVGLNVQVLDSLSLFGAYGSAFRAPSANDLYYPGFGSYGGNPDLEPEKARESELGLEFKASGQRVRLSAYRNIVRNLIQASPTAPNNMENIARARLQGLELDVSGKLALVDYRLNGSSLSAKDGTGAALARRPHAAFNADVGVNVTDTVKLGAEVQARSSAHDGSVLLGGYTTGALYAHWKTLPGLTLGARVENVTDKDYQVVNGYNTPERAGYITAAYSWR